METLETKRLILRQPEAADVAAITAGLADFEVSKNLMRAPHPYSEADAWAFVSAAAKGHDSGESYCFVLIDKGDGALLGCAGLERKNGAYELGYWLAKPYWKQGLATEAAARVLEFAFDRLKAERVEAGWYHDNGTSGHVLAKLGFKADHVEACESRARGYRLLCNRAVLTRAEFGRKKAA
jgi:[ribosomal protein S5]-alanine N-acetyltransferase